MASGTSKSVVGRMTGDLEEGNPNADEAPLAPDIVPGNQGTGNAKEAGMGGFSGLVKETKKKVETDRDLIFKDSKTVEDSMKGFNESVDGSSENEEQKKESATEGGSSYSAVKGDSKDSTKDFSDTGRFSGSSTPILMASGTSKSVVGRMTGDLEEDNPNADEAPLAPDIVPGNQGTGNAKEAGMGGFSGLVKETKKKVETDCDLIFKDSKTVEDSKKGFNESVDGSSENEEQKKESATEGGSSYSAVKGDSKDSTKDFSDTGRVSGSSTPILMASGTSKSVVGRMTGDLEEGNPNADEAHLAPDIVPGNQGTGNAKEAGMGGFSGLVKETKKKAETARDLIFKDSKTVEDSKKGFNESVDGSSENEEQKKESATEGGSSYSAVKGDSKDSTKDFSDTGRVSGSSEKKDCPKMEHTLGNIPIEKPFTEGLNRRIDDNDKGTESPKSDKDVSKKQKTSESDSGEPDKSPGGDIGNVSGIPISAEEESTKDFDEIFEEQKKESEKPHDAISKASSSYGIKGDLKDSMSCYGGNEEKDCSEKERTLKFTTKGNGQVYQRVKGTESLKSDNEVLTKQNSISGSGEPEKSPGGDIMTAAPELYTYLYNHLMLVTMIYSVITQISFACLNAPAFCRYRWVPTTLLAVLCLLHIGSCGKKAKAYIDMKSQRSNPNVEKAKHERMMMHTHLEVAFWFLLVLTYTAVVISAVWLYPCNGKIPAPCNGKKTE